MGRTDELLLEFLEQNPQYFTGAPDAQFIREDLRRSVEAYARAIDPEAYERLTERVLEFQANARAAMKEKMAELAREKERQARLLREAEHESREFEAKMKELREEMKKYRYADAAAGAGARTGGALDYLYLLLDILGIGFLYAGFILTDQINYSLGFAGFVLLFTGLFLYAGGSGKGNSAHNTRKSEVYEKLQARFEKVQDVWKLKQFALEQRISASRQEIRKIDLKMQACLQKVSLNSD
ncbi:MAG: hypothetical protein ACLFU4_07005 [Opitutales bacterium]